MCDRSYPPIKWQRLVPFFGAAAFFQWFLVRVVNSQLSPNKLNSTSWPWKHVGVEPIRRNDARLHIFQYFCESCNYINAICDWMLCRVISWLSLQCTVVGCALDWTSEKLLSHDRECLTKLLEWTFIESDYQRLILGWGSDKEGFEG